MIFEKNVFGFLYVKLIVLPKILHFEEFNIENGFPAIKHSGQGSFKANKGTIDKLLFLLKTIGIYP